MAIGSDFCCICGRQVRSWNNPDPIREGTLDCCSDCNLLVRTARERIFRMDKESGSAFASALREMPYETLRSRLLTEGEDCP